ncbi:hypothetical protein [Microbacterium sp.]|uniref:hypothetical protein n=1 Tax=Microbacterium sp. TaxID=51671 RepID=UPI001ACFF530|nr:hypothetical protein [Microbacterium sp.]MBN9155816.1 hypothetical protein [Microbacterium sp.]
MIDQVPAPNRLAELPEGTREFLAGLRPDELATLQAIVELPAEDVRAGFKLVRDARTVGRFGRWFIVSAISFFIGAVVLYEYVLKALGYLKGKF